MGQPRPYSLAMRRLELTIVTGLAAFIGLVAIQHPLRGDLPPGDHFVSEYAKGSTSALQVAAFVFWAIALAAGSLLVARAAGPARRIARAIAAFGLGLGAAGITVSAIFATQTVAGVLPEGVQRTTTGRLHDLGTLAVFAGLLLAAGASLRFAPRRGYRIALAALFAILMLTIPILVALGIDAPGIGQRVFILVGCGFEWVLAVELSGRRRSPSAGARTPRRSRSAG